MQKLHPITNKRIAKAPTASIKELQPLIKEFKNLPRLGLNTKIIVSVKRFGSSVEGKAKPNDYDYFIIVKNGSIKFTKKAGLPAPLIKNIGKNQFFIMPESDGVDLLNAMLYTGRKDPQRMYSSRTVDITNQFKAIYNQAKVI